MKLICCFRQHPVNFDDQNTAYAVLEVLVNGKTALPAQFLPFILRKHNFRQFGLYNYFSTSHVHKMPLLCANAVNASHVKKGRAQLRWWQDNAICKVKRSIYPSLSGSYILWQGRRLFSSGEEFLFFFPLKKLICIISHAWSRREKEEENKVYLQSPLQAFFLCFLFGKRQHKFAWNAKVQRVAFAFAFFGSKSTSIPGYYWSNDVNVSNYYVP